MKMKKTLLLAVVLLSVGSLINAQDINSEYKRISGIVNKQDKANAAMQALNNFFKSGVKSDQIVTARKLNKFITERAVRDRNTQTLNALKKSLAMTKVKGVAGGAAQTAQIKDLKKQLDSANKKIDTKQRIVDYMKNKWTKTDLAKTKIQEDLATLAKELSTLAKNTSQPVKKIETASNSLNASNVVTQRQVIQDNVTELIKKLAEIADKLKKLTE